MVLPVPPTADARFDPSRAGAITNGFNRARRVSDEHYLFQVLLLDHRCDIVSESVGIVPVVGSIRPPMTPSIRRDAAESLNCLAMIHVFLCLLAAISGRLLRSCIQ